MRDGLKLFLGLAFAAVCLISMGFIFGYVHVIVNSKAWFDAAEGVIMEVDGNLYHYVVAIL